MKNKKLITLPWRFFGTFAAVFAVYVIGAFGFGAYLGWSITADQRQILSNNALDLNSFLSRHQAGLMTLSEILSLHGYRTLRYDHGIPTLPGGGTDLILNGVLVGGVFTPFLVGLQLLMTLLPGSRRVGLPPVRSASELILSKRDLYGAAIVHFLITIAVTLFHISNGISAFPDPSIELLFLLVQLPLAAVIYPLSWANPAATEFKVILLVLVANSMAASLAINSLRTLAKSGTEAPFARPPKVGWILAWSTALGIFLYGGRVEWSSLAPLSRVWNLVVLYFITTAAVSWLFLLQRRTKASPDTVVWRAVNGIVLVGFLLGTVQSSIDPIRLLFRAEGDTLDALLLQTLKEGRPLSDQFLVMGDLSDFNTAPARYRITTVPMAVLSVPTELHVGTKCYFTGQELTEMTPEEASDWVSNDAAVLQLTSSNVFASLDQVKQSLHDAAPSHEISLEEIARFLSRQKLCALRRLSFFGPFAAPVLPLIQAFPDDEATAIQVTETIRALSE